MIAYECWTDEDGEQHREPVCSVCGKWDYEEETTFTTDGKAICVNCQLERDEFLNEIYDEVEKQNRKRDNK